MICERVHSLIGDFLDGTLDTRTREAVALHLEQCETCRDIFDTREDGAEDLETPPNLLSTVLSETSGTICGSAEAKLVEYVEGDLGAEDGQLVSLHLDGCSDCRAVEHSLRQLAIDLKYFEEMEPGLGFTRRVVEATSERESWSEAIIGLGRRLVARPRFALELAYAGTLAVTAVLWLAGAGNIGQEVGRISRTANEQSFVATGEFLKDASVETVEITSNITTGVSQGVKESVVTGTAVVGDRRNAMADRAALASEWTREKLGAFKGRFQRIGGEPNGAAASIPRDPKTQIKQGEIDND